MRKMTFSEAGKLGALAAKEIQAKQKQKRKEEYYKNPKKCPICNENISYEVKSVNKFCSSSCSAKHNNKGVCRHSGANKPQTKPCLFCKNLTKNPKFCSSLCYTKFKKKKHLIKLKTINTL